MPDCNVAMSEHCRGCRCSAKLENSACLPSGYGTAADDRRYHILLARNVLAAYNMVLVAVNGVLRDGAVLDGQ